MFTGIVTDVGTIDVRHAYERGRAPCGSDTAYDPAGIDIGASIACSGTCLTVTGLPQPGDNGRWFEVEAWEEALRLTTIGDMARRHTRINLERSLKIGDELGGHLVSGHVDGLAEIVSVTDEGDARRFRIRAPENAGEVHRTQGLGRARWDVFDSQRGGGSTNSTCF